MANSVLPAGYSARSIELGDIDEIAELFRRRDESFGLQPEHVHAFLHWMLRLPYVRLERDTVVVRRGGAIVAAMTSFRDPASEGARLTSEAAVDPSVRGLGIGGWLLDRLDEIVASRRAELPFDVHALALAVDEPARDLLAAHGFVFVRVSHEMAIDLAGPRPAFELPHGVTIRSFEVGRDERTFWYIDEVAFEGHFGHTASPYESFAAAWYGATEWDPARVLFAEVEGVAVGVVAWVDADPDGYIANVSVLPEHRRRGIARALLRRAFDDIAAAGNERATLTVDSENAHGAVDLYEAMGMRAYRQWHVFARPAS